MAESGLSFKKKKKKIWVVPTGESVVEVTISANSNFMNINYKKKS